MALDHALATHAGEGEAVLRLYRWEAPTISFGRNEPAQGRYREEEARRRGLDFVRRPTGGRAVLHHREVTYGVVIPVRAFGGLKRTYETINEGLLRGLQALGVPAEMARSGQGAVVAPVDRGPCFQEPAPGEITVRGRKLVGSAQVRLGGTVLQHGSIILAGSQEVLRSVRVAAEEDGGAGAASGAAPATVSDVLRRSVSWWEAADAIEEGCRLAWGGRWTDGEYREEEAATAERLLDERYGRPEWTWRR
ncbi:MAG: biotin/lipoate A/B protein ligase family protein [Gemmatimonadota bacterium]